MGRRRLARRCCRAHGRGSAGRHERSLHQRQHRGHRAARSPSRGRAVRRADAQRPGGWFVNHRAWPSRLRATIAGLKALAAPPSICTAVGRSVCRLRDAPLSRPTRPRRGEHRVVGDDLPDHVPEREIYVGMDLSGTLTYFGSVDSKPVEADHSPEQRRDCTIRKQILWSPRRRLAVKCGGGKWSSSARCAPTTRRLAATAGPRSGRDLPRLAWRAVRRRGCCPTPRFPRGPARRRRAC